MLCLNQSSFMQMPVEKKQEKKKQVKRQQVNHIAWQSEREGGGGLLLTRTLRKTCVCRLPMPPHSLSLSLPLSHLFGKCAVASSPFSASSRSCCCCSFVSQGLLPTDVIREERRSTKQKFMPHNSLFYTNLIHCQKVATRHSSSLLHSNSTDYLA